MSNKVAPSPLYDILKQMKAETFADLRVCLPGSIAGVDATTGTVSANIGVMQNIAQMGFPTGKDFRYPQLTGCPVFSVQGGGVGAIMPVTIGDECLIIFSDRAINNWFTTGEAMPLPSFRMHDISDGFVLVGLNPLQNPLLTPLSANEGGICETQNALGAKVVVNSATSLISIKNATQNLAVILSLLTTTLITMNTALEALNTVLAADSGLNGASHAALATANVAIAAASVSLATVATDVAALLY